MDNSNIRKMINEEQNTDNKEYNNIITEDSDKFRLSFDSRNYNKSNTENNFYEENEMCLTNYFSIRNKTHDNNFYINHRKTMSELKKVKPKIKNRTIYLNTINYKTNKKKYPNIINQRINSQSLDFQKRPFINKKVINRNVNNKLKRYLLPIHLIHEVKEELFPKFKFLSPENKAKYNNLINKNKKLILNTNINYLNIENEVENVKNNNYITNKIIKDNQRDFFQTNINYKFNDNEKDNLKENNKLFEIPFYQRKTKYKKLNQFKYHIENPVEKYKAKEFFKNFDTIYSITRMISD